MFCYVLRSSFAFDDKKNPDCCGSFIHEEDVLRVSVRVVCWYCFLGRLKGLFHSWQRMSDVTCCVQSTPSRICSQSIAGFGEGKVILEVLQTCANLVTSPVICIVRHPLRFCLSSQHSRNQNCVASVVMENDYLSAREMLC